MAPQPIGWGSTIQPNTVVRFPRLELSNPNPAGHAAAEVIRRPRRLWHRNFISRGARVESAPNQSWYSAHDPRAILEFAAIVLRTNPDGSVVQVKDNRRGHLHAGRGNHPRGFGSVLVPRQVEATLIPLVAVPVSIVGTFAVMLAIGYSANTVSLLALVLAIGIVLDDAIVVVENVERRVTPSRTW